jgi:hypothetical protein
MQIDLVMSTLRWVTYWVICWVTQRDNGYGYALFAGNC